MSSLVTRIGLLALPAYGVVTAYSTVKPEPDQVTIPRAGPDSSVAPPTWPWSVLRRRPAKSATERCRIGADRRSALDRRLDAATMDRRFECPRRSDSPGRVRRGHHGPRVRMRSGGSPPAC